MDVWEVPPSFRSGLDRGFLMDVGPTRASRFPGIGHEHAAGAFMWHRRIYYHLALHAHRAGPTADRPRFEGRDRESLGTTACVRRHPAVGLGIARPLIVLPSALVTGWSPAQVELALLHELAYVRRWDHLVNLL
jgi:hypothetical protein